jgi:tetratricopeptide (TPR) repeat protein
MGSGRAQNFGVTYLIICACCALNLLTSAVLCNRAFAWELNATDQIISAIQHRLERNPKDLKALLTLEDAYARKARETEDALYYGLAEQALSKAVENHPNHAGSRRHLAYVLSLAHEFQRAAEEAQKATKLNPKDRRLRFSRRHVARVGWAASATARVAPESTSPPNPQLARFPSSLNIETVGLRRSWICPAFPTGSRSIAR